MSLKGTWIRYTSGCEIRKKTKVFSADSSGPLQFTMTMSASGIHASTVTVMSWKEQDAGTHKAISAV